MKILLSLLFLSLNANAVQIKHSLISPYAFSDITGINGFSGGGTNASTQQGALDSIVGSVSTGFVRCNGTHCVNNTIQVSDVPTLNQNTTGQSGTALALASTPAQCTGGQFSTGVTANGTANCSTPSGTISGLTTNGMAYASGSTAIATGTPAPAGYVFASNGSGSAPSPQQVAGNSTIVKAPNITTLNTNGTATGKVFRLTTSPTVSAGATYTNNSNTYTVTYAMAATTNFMWASGTGTISGTTLTKASGTGPATLTLQATNGSYNTATYTTPTSPSPIWLQIEICAGGGGGGGAGTGTSASSTGGTGGDSFFGGINVGGGAGGTGGTTTTPGLGGVCSSGAGSQGSNFTIIAANGALQYGFDAYPLLSAAFTVNGGEGAVSPMPVYAGTIFSAGNGGQGGNGTSSVYPGGGGGTGGCFKGYTASPLSTYPYVIGAAGTAGSGTASSGVAAASGGAIVTAYFQ